MKLDFTRTKHFGRISNARLISSVFAQSTGVGAGYVGFVNGDALIGPSILVNWHLSYFAADP
jgi:hypothetical protein